MRINSFKHTCMFACVIFDCLLGLGLCMLLLFKIKLILHFWNFSEFCAHHYFSPSPFLTTILLIFTFFVFVFGESLSIFSRSFYLVSSYHDLSSIFCPSPMPTLVDFTWRLVLIYSLMSIYCNADWPGNLQ